MKNFNDNDEQHFLEQLNEILNLNFRNYKFTADAVSKKLYVSRATLYRKLKQKTGKSFSSYVLDFRLAQARLLLNSVPRPLVKQVAFAVGYSKVSHFSKRFYKRFGILPSKLSFES